MEVLGEHYQPVDVEAACIIQRNNSTSRSIEWSSPSPSSAPAIYSHKVEATPINNIPYSEENCKVEYPLHPVCRLLAFIGFLFSGAVGLFIALYGLVVALGVLKFGTHSDNIRFLAFFLAFVAAYLGVTASVLILSMVLLSMTMSVILVVLWKWEGRVPCPGNIGLAVGRLLAGRLLAGRLLAFIGFLSYGAVGLFLDLCVLVISNAPQISRWNVRL